MQIYLSLALFFVYLLAEVQTATTKTTTTTVTPVIITSASCRSASAAVPQGSMAGGTTLYIKASGLSTTASKNAVFVGSYPCIVPENGVSGLSIICVTSQANPDDKSLGSLPIVVKVSGKADSTCQAGAYCYFTYLQSLTSQLYYVTPRVNYPQRWSYFRGKFLIGSLSSGQLQIQYDNQICDRSQSSQTDIDANDDIVQCQVPSDSVAGVYNVIVSTVNGNQNNYLSVSQQYTTSQDTYQSIILPVITGLDKNTLSKSGGKLNIYGLGFGYGTCQVRVYVGGQIQSKNAIVIGNDGSTITVNFKNITLEGKEVYVDGSGLRYKRWWGNTVYQNNYIGEPDVQNVLGQYYNQQFVGFFKAPKTGKYRFYVASDDRATVELNKNPLSIDNTKLELIAENNLSSYRNYWQSEYASTPVNSISDYIDLEEEQYYQIQINHTNGAGVGYVTVSVEIENDQVTEYSVGALYQIKTSYTPIKEQVEYIVYNKISDVPLSGKYQLVFASTTSTPPFTYTTDWIATTATPSQVAQYINNLGVYSVSVTSTKVNFLAEDLVDQTSNVFAGYRYVITFNYYRRVQVRPNFVFNITTNANAAIGKSTQTLVTPATPIEGTFQLSYVDYDGVEQFLQIGTSYDLPFNMTASQLADAIQTSTGYRPLVWNEGTADNGYIWKVQMKGVQELQDFRVPNNNLLSGNGEVQVTITTLSESSTNTLYEPIPNELLFTYSKVPTVSITLNGLLSTCGQEGACNLDAPVDLKLTITDFTYDEISTLKVHVSTVGSANSDSLDDTLSTISFNDYDCVDILMEQIDDYEYDFTCTVDGNVFEYGKYYPTFHYENYGNADIDSSVQPYQAPLVITHIGPTSGSEDGGTLVTLFGKGFPTEITQDLTIVLGGVNAVIKSTSATEIVIKTPTYDQSMVNSVIDLTFKDGAATNQDFTYDHTIHITITQIKETILTPIYKGFNTIIGSGFGHIISDITVQLVNDKKVYDCPVVSVKDDEIVVYLRGGLPGEYRFIVNRVNVGEATAAGDINKFQYNTVITSIENATGSDAGGTRIKINGFNFVPQETIVFIGDEINWICDLDENASTSTELYCITPPKHIRYTTPQQVIVTTRILFDSVCQGNCEFTYDSSQTVQCTAPQDSTVSSGARLLTKEQLLLPDYQKYIKQHKFQDEQQQQKKKYGVNHDHSYNYTNSRRDLSFWNEYILDKIKNYTVDQVENIQCVTTTSQEVQITFNDQYTVTATISETGQLTYNVPDLPQGEYKTKIITQNGYATSMWITNIELTIQSVSTTTVVQGGQDIEIDGTGFGDNNNIEVYFGTLKCLRLKKHGNRKLKCRTPRITNLSAYPIKILYDDVRKHSQIKSSCSHSTNISVTNIGQPSITQVKNNAGIVYVSSKSAYTYNTSTETLTFDIVGANLVATNLNVHLEKDGFDDVVGTITFNNATLISVTFTNVPLGQFDIMVSCDDKVALWNTWQYQKIVFQNPILSGQLPKASWKGGKHLEIHGHGFSEKHEVRVCGKKCGLLNVNYHSILCRVPDFNPAWAKKIEKGLKQKHEKIDHDDYHVTSDVTDKSVLQKFFDGSETTYISSNSATNCWVQVDFGKHRKLKLEYLSFLPKIDSAANYLKGAKFQYSIDGTTFKDWITIDDDVHNGWNVQRPKKCEEKKEKNEHGGKDKDDEPEKHNDNDELDGIRAIRLIDPRGTSGSRCTIADIDIRGWLENDSQDETQNSCDAELFVDGNSAGIISQSVTYDQTITPVITQVTPKDISPNTQTVVTITGNGFVEGQTQVFIDEIECVIQSVSTSQINCLSGLKDVTTSSITGQFKVIVNNDEAIVNDKLIYGMRWSDIQTWGGYVFPSDGDSVMVYEGATLIVDVHTPKLVQVLVEGNLIFADDDDTSLDAQYLVINRGKLQIGTQEYPHQHKVHITIRGEEKGIQYPNMGNKLIGCNQCIIDIHGQDRSPSWSLLTITPTDNLITVDDPVNWQIGDQVIITSSSVSQTETEVRKIVGISQDKRTLTLDEQLTNIHKSSEEYYDGILFTRKVEVGCLTRSIVIEGEKTDLHGVHIYIQGQQDEGTEVRIENVEIINGGQQRYLNRFPINFNNNGIMSNSYIRGNSIHHSNARCIGIQSISHLQISDNICYNIIGHAIYLQNGNEKDNTFDHNLISVVKSSWQLYQTDATASAFWITNPQNTFTNNRVGGSEWYGFYLAFKSNPTGAASTSDVCPTGQQLLKFENNAAHSTGRIGLRIGTFIPKTSPCLSHRNDALDDPFSQNPSIQSKLSGFITFANAQIGVLTENLGNVLLENIFIAESKLAGYQQHKANYSAEGTTIRNFVIVGENINTGLIVPRTNGFLADTIHFVNFPATSTIIESCSGCSSYLLWVTGGKNTHFKGIKIINSDNARLIHWNNFRREIFWDLDGSLTGITTGAQIMAYKLHIDGLNGCTFQNNTKWDQSIICDSQQTKIRDFIINYPTPYDQHVNYALKIYRVPSLNAQLPIDIKQYQYEQWVGIWSGDIAYSFASQFALGYTYNLNLYNNWLSISFMASQYLKVDEPGIVFRFNYTVQRETFDVFRNRNNKFISNYNQVTTIPDPNTCNNGDWYNDRTTSFFYICISGKQRVQSESIAVYGIYCRENCPAYIGDAPKIQKKWSDVSIWPNGRLPQAGENVTISFEYIITIDIDLPEFDTILILGELWFDNGRAVTTLKARKIFVRNGRLVAGSITQSFTSIINIILTGSISDYDLLIDNNIEAGNNILAVTGGLELYGKAPSSKVAYLISSLTAGSLTIQVSDSTDWQIGDWIVISSTGSNPDESEKVQIIAISGTTITLNTALKYNHNGQIIDTKIDTRAQVLHLTRNIRITSSTDWGFRVLVYSFSEQSILRRGYVQLHGVEFINGGQVNKEFAGLDIQYSVGGDPIPDSDIIGCSFHDSQGYLFTVENSENVNIQQNVFYNGQKALVQIVNSQRIKFQFNTLVLVQKRVISINSAITGTHNWAVLGSFRYSSGSKIIKSNILVTNNIGIGSTDTGFHVMATSCDDEANSGFYSNKCYNTVQACFHLIQSNSKCNTFKSFTAYNSAVGLMASIYTESFKLSDFIVAESDRGIVIKPGSSNIYSNVVYVQNGQIIALYEGIRCSNTLAFQLVSVSSNAYPPISRSSNNADYIHTIQRVDTRVYLDNVQFYNYKLNYENYPQCNNNAVFRQNVYALDVVGQHYLTNSNCNDCQFDSLLFNLRNPNYDKLGWYGGCGQMVCNGQTNFLIEDQTGTFFGEKGQAIGNNTNFNNSFCLRQEKWNGYWCPTFNMGVLNFISTAPDQNTRLFSPTTLTSPYFSNVLNAFAEWNWDGPEPQNSRESKFVGLIQINSTINMTNKGENPTNSDYWLSKRTANGPNDEWVIIQLQFDVPNIVQVSADGKIVQPGLTRINQHLDLTQYTNQCGANNYFYENRTIHFVVTAGCKVSLSLKNTLMISTRLEITTNEFFGDKFLQYAFALLGGDPYNYFIVGTYKSKNRRFLADTYDIQWAIIDNATIGTPEAQNSQSNLEQIAANLQSFNPSEIGNVVSITAEIQAITTLNYPSTEQPDTTSTNNNDDNNYYNGNEPVNQDDEEYIDPQLNDDLFQQNDDVGDDEQSDEVQNQASNTTTLGLKQPKKEGDDNTLLISVVSAVGGVVLISLFVSAAMWNRRQNVIKTRVHQQSQSSPAAHDILSKPEQMDDDIVQYKI